MKKLLLALCVPFMFSAVQAEEVFDPLEPVNRGVFWFNSKLDRYVFVPVAKGYRYAVPEVIRDRVGDGLHHLGEPITFANAILQLDGDKAASTFWRFVVNSSLGVGGFVDVAEEFGLDKTQEDMGQTLGRYGVPGGPYIVLPLLGPTTTRDFLARGVDGFGYAPNYAHDIARYGVRGIDAVHTREQLLELGADLMEDSFDPYSALKSAYVQHRNKKIKE